MTCILEISCSEVSITVMGHRVGSGKDTDLVQVACDAPLDILLITHNGLGHLQRLLPTLNRTTYPNYRLLLLDNGSSDGSREWMEQNWPGVIVVRSETNLGFAGINNRGLERSIADGTKYALLLNDDTEILDPDWVSRAVEFLEATPSASVIGFEETCDPQAPVGEPKVRETDWVSGFAVLFRVETLKKVGLFDEKYFAYWEERDLEARIAAGGNGIYQISIPVYHRGGGTFGRATSKYVYLMMRNAIRYSLKNEGIKQAIKRPIQYFLIAVSPFPMFKTPHALHMRQAMYRPKYVPRNFWLLLKAIGWNLIHTKVRDNNRTSHRHASDN